MATVTACGSGGSPSPPPPRPTTTLPATTSTTVRTRTLVATLTGTAVVPGPGAPTASGQARVTLDPVTGELCWDVAVSGLDAPGAVHLHTAPLGAVGPATVALASGAGCTGVAPELAASVVANPEGFYVDVHDGGSPGGALRGQLGS